jgi:uncharacterized protein YjbJ (UPF0337 family)
MNSDRIVGNWKYFKGRIREEWALLARDASGVMSARREQIAGRMQRLCGAARQQSERQLRQWRASMKKTRHAA